MSEAWSQSQVLPALLGAGLLFLIQTALSVVLEAVSALSRVALHRLSHEPGSRLGFVEGLRDPVSARRAAVSFARQLCLLGGVSLIVLASHRAGWPNAGVAGFGLGALVGVLLLEFWVARPLALWAPKGALRTMAFLIGPVYLATWPVVQPLHLVLRRIGRMQSTDDDREDDQDEEVEAFIEVGEREGILEANEGEMMRSIVDLDETHVREIMTPRTDIVAAPQQTTVAEARRVILEAGHSRLPVYRDTIDEVVGVLHERDLLRAWEEGDGERPISAYLRELMFVPEHLSVADLLSEMQVKTHIALVVDEYGGVAGLVTLEDLLEEIVGDIRDEHDREEPPIRKASDGSWLIRGAAHVEELEDLFGVEFEKRDFDTVGGLVVSSLGRVPAEGELLRIRDLQIEVLKADRRRIRLVRIRPLEPSEAQAGP